MSAEVISMDEWQKAQIVDWAVRFGSRLLAQLPQRDQERMLKRLERDTTAHQQTEKDAKA